MKNDINRFEVFTSQIAKISKCIRTIKTAEFAKFNLQGSHVSCLYYLKKHPEGLTSKELSEISGDDKALISRSVETLGAGGFLICSAEKRYKCPIFLTEIGQELGDFVVKKIEDVLDGVSDGVSPKQRNVFYKVLLKISENLEKICKNLGVEDDKNISRLGV